MSTQASTNEGGADGAQFQVRGFAAEDPNEGKPGLTAEEADRMASRGAASAQESAEGAGEPEGAPGEGGAEGQTASQTTAAGAGAAKIRIGTREFTNQDEALAYAQELELEKVAADAFRQGVELTAQQTQSNPPPEPEKLDPLYYTDPLAWQKQREAKIKADLKAELDREAQTKVRTQETWQKFFTDYPDLDKARPLVDHVYATNFERLKNVRTEVALKEIAEQARKLKREIVAAELPGRDLTQTRAGASQGKGTGGNPPPAQEQDLSFVEQFRKIKAKRTAAKMRR